MTSVLSLTDVVTQQLDAARSSSAGRSAHTLHGGTGHSLRQTVLALAAGRGLDEHESPGDASLQVLVGRVRLRAGSAVWQGTTGDYVVIPESRHSLDALEDSAVLLTVALPLAVSTGEPSGSE